MSETYMPMNMRLSDRLANLEGAINLLGMKLAQIEEQLGAQQLTNDFIIGMLDSMKQKLIKACPAYMEKEKVWPLEPAPKPNSSMRLSPKRKPSSKRWSKRT